VHDGIKSLGVYIYRSLDEIRLKLCHMVFKLKEDCVVSILGEKTSPFHWSNHKLSP
jgi:hypothetical protein